MISLRVVCSELAAGDLGCPCAGLSLGQEWVWLCRRGFLVTWEIAGGREKEFFPDSLGLGTWHGQG